MHKPASSRIHLLVLVAFQLALFLPMVGHGFVFDDFNHVYSVAHQSFRDGLTRAQGGPFFNPLTWLAFKADWIVWGGRSFPMGVENLLLHVGNTLMVYLLAVRLWKSPIAAWWTALGFALLFPANTWIAMFIATRAHALAAFFYLAALLATLWYAESMPNRAVAGAAIVSCAGFSMFAKESGVTVIAAIFIVLVYYRQSLRLRVLLPGDIVLFLAVFAVVAVYGALRWQSGAIFLTASPDPRFVHHYTYAASLSRLTSNLGEFLWRTYGLLLALAGSIMAREYLRGSFSRLTLPRKCDVFLSVALFAVTLSPFLLLSVRSGTYSYMPGIGAALLLGASTRERPTQTASPVARRPVVAAIPVVVMVAICVGFTIGQSLKWLYMANVSRTVLAQIAAQQPEAKPGTFFLLRYRETDRRHRFPDAFAGDVFPLAVRLLYGDPSLDGRIIRSDENYSVGDGAPLVRFDYAVVDNNPTVVRLR